MSQSNLETARSKNNVSVVSLTTWGLLVLAMVISGITWWRSQTIYAELKLLRAEQASLKAASDKLSERRSESQTSASTSGMESDSKSPASATVEPLNASKVANEKNNTEEAVASLNVPLKTGTSECKIDERCLILEDVRPGAVIISMVLKDMPSSNRSDLLVISPKHHESFPHNPPGILTAKYADSASPSQINDIDYEIVWAGFRFDLYATVRTYGPVANKPPILVHWMTLPVR